MNMNLWLRDECVKQVLPPRPMCNYLRVLVVNDHLSEDDPANGNLKISSECVTSRTAERSQDF